jgi:peptide/nickel transport system permease protein
MAIFAPLIAPHSPYEHNYALKIHSPSNSYIMGNDQYGRGVFSRIVYGTRSVLQIGLLTAVVSAVVGTSIGLVAGYAGGTVDRLITAGVDVMMSFPPMILGIMVIAIMGVGLYKVIWAIAISLTPGFIRLTRVAVVSIKHTTFIEASKAMGASHIRIIGKHVLPNISDTILVMFALWASKAIIAAASLGFLGLGVQPPDPEWGYMLRQGMELLYCAPHMVVFPGLMIVLLILALNALSDALRDVLDPKTLT